MSAIALLDVQGADAAFAELVALAQAAAAQWATLHPGAAGTLPAGAAGAFASGGAAEPAQVQPVPLKPDPHSNSPAHEVQLTGLACRPLDGCALTPALTCCRAWPVSEPRS